jgi:16S rRNA processing protein RimM
VPRKQASGRSAQTQLRVGRLTKAHGLKGALKLELFTDDPDRRFQPGSEFALQVPEESPWHGKRITINELRWYNGHPVGFFAGVSDREAAETLVKAILWVDQTADEPAEDDAWYDHQLVGLDVIRDGAKVGVIARLEHFPAQDLLVITADGGREVMVPFVRAIVPTVDLESGTVTVTPPVGLFEDIPDDDLPDDDLPDEPASADQQSDDAPSVEEETVEPSSADETASAEGAAGEGAADDGDEPTAPAS